MTCSTGSRGASGGWSPAGPDLAGEAASGERWAAVELWSGVIFLIGCSRQRHPLRKAAATKPKNTSAGGTLLGHINRRWVGITACCYALADGEWIEDYGY